MIIYIAGSALLLVVGIMATRAMLKHRRREKKQLAIASSYDRLVRKSKLSVEFSDFFAVCNGEKQEVCIPLSEVADSERRFTELILSKR